MKLLRLCLKEIKEREMDNKKGRRTREDQGGGKGRQNCRHQREEEEIWDKGNE